MSSTRAAATAPIGPDYFQADVRAGWRRPSRSARSSCSSISTTSPTGPTSTIRRWRPRRSADAGHLPGADEPAGRQRLPASGAVRRALRVLTHEAGCPVRGVPGRQQKLLCRRRGGTTLRLHCRPPVSGRWPSPGATYMTREVRVHQESARRAGQPPPVLQAPRRQPAAGPSPIPQLPPGWQREVDAERPPTRASPPRTARPAPAPSAARPSPCSRRTPTRRRRRSPRRRRRSRGSRPAPSTATSPGSWSTRPTRRSTCGTSSRSPTPARCRNTGTTSTWASTTSRRARQPRGLPAPDAAAPAARTRRGRSSTRR